jgi:dipeptidyl-peptidase-4
MDGARDRSLFPTTRELAATGREPTPLSPTLGERGLFAPHDAHRFCKQSEGIFVTEKTGGMLSQSGYGPDWETYVRAERLLPWNASKLVFGLDIEPHWIDGGKAFWYRADRRTGTELVRVDAATLAKSPAFDHARLAAALSAATGIPFAPERLPFQTFAYTDDGAAIEVIIEQERWTVRLADYACAKGEPAPEAPKEVVRSPDGTLEAFVRDHNLFLRTVATGVERQLTKDGAAQNGYGASLASPLAGAGLEDPAPSAVVWSPDGGHLVSCRIDERDALKFHLVQSIPPDGGVRPVLHTYAYPLPGDTAVPLAEIWCFDVKTGKGVKAQTEPWQMLYYGSALWENAIWWSGDASRLYLLRRDRGYLSYRLIAVETATGAARDLIVETFGHGIDPYLYWAAVNVRVISGGAETVWYAFRDGWGHLYLYDTERGAQLRQLTAGAYNVAEISHIDEQNRLLYFRALGKEAGWDPYFSALYRVSLDGGEPELLTPEPSDHAIVFAPNGKWFLDTYSRVDLAPVTLLRAADGKRTLELERADIDAFLATGVPLPERFVAKARDGVTDVYGVILRPSGFDPARNYPVIDSIYAGPQRNQAPAGFAGYTAHEAGKHGVGGRWYWQGQALAELGFIVVMVDGMGMPGRSKAFHDVTYLDIGDGGLPDHISALRQLADRYPAFDLTRVGIYGHSAGGYASAHAILTYPDFFHVAVSSAGNHDHRLDKATWVERYMGVEVGDHYRRQANQTLAANLKGKLLLIHGELDENVHPASTLVLVDALIKENKEFDLLIVPNRPHALDDQPYFVRRRWDYFVRHLLRAEPPAGYKIAQTGEWQARWS